MSALGSVTFYRGPRWAHPNRRGLADREQERDEVYGTVDFIRRGSTKLLRATCYMDVSEASGDVVHYVLQTHTGRPLMLDFNNSTSVIYDRLLVYGFYSSVKTVINAGTFEVLSIDVEGLVE